MPLKVLWLVVKKVTLTSLQQMYKTVLLATQAGWFCAVLAPRCEAKTTRSHLRDLSIQRATARTACSCRAAKAMSSRANLTGRQRSGFKVLNMGRTAVR